MRNDNELHKEALRRELIKGSAKTLLALAAVFLLTGIGW